MKQQTFMLYYKDKRGEPSHFFGPFVSERMAYEFADDLPEPQETGIKSVYPVSTYTFDESGLAADYILSNRH